jgi:hypothetical protein
MVRDVMLHPAKLRACMEHFREDTGAAELRLEKEVKAVEGRLQAVHEQKRRVIDIYVSGDLSRDGYVQKNRELDGLVETLTARNRELEDAAALLRNSGAIDAGIAQFCEGARMRFAKCADFASKRQFLLDHVEKVVHLKDTVALHGSVPIKTGHGEDAETNKLPSCIESEITKAERYLERMRTRDVLMYQQGMAMLEQSKPTKILQ